MLLLNYDLFFRSFGYELPYDIVWTTLFLGLVAVFGIGYLLLGVNPLQNRQIALIGTLGKIFVFTIILIFTIRGIISPLVTATTFLDVVFAILFIEYLIRIRKME
jgi:hypothetical protein